MGFGKCVCVLGSVGANSGGDSEVLRVRVCACGGARGCVELHWRRGMTNALD